MTFDHMFDHFAKNSLISYPGVAQLVGRLVWDQDAASSSLATRTRITVVGMNISTTVILFYFNTYVWRYTYGYR